MTNSDIFYNHAKQYQDGRKQAMDAFEKRLAELETAKGSQFYVDEIKKAEAKRDSSIAALKEEHGNVLFKSLGWMLDSAIKQPVVPPTAEQMNIINAVHMRKNITKEEINSIARSLADCPLALSLLQEKVDDIGLIGCSVWKYAESQKFSVKEIESIVKGCKTSISDFLDYDTSKAARKVRQRNENLYGTKDSAPLPKRTLFSSKAECFESLLGVQASNVNRFINTVD